MSLVEKRLDNVIEGLGVTLDNMRLVIIKGLGLSVSLFIPKHWVGVRSPSANRK